MNKEFKIYHTETQEDYDDLMIKLEDDGYLWASGDKPTDLSFWYKFEAETVIYLGSWRKGEVTRGDLSEAKSKYPAMPIIKHKAKGVEQMEKVVVPQFVADWYEKHEKGRSIYGIIGLLNDLSKCDDEKMFTWKMNCEGRNNHKLSNAQEVIAKMYLYGYEIEVEKKYNWRKKKEYMFDLEQRRPSCFINLDTDDGIVFFDDTEECSSYRTKFAEEEIKQLLSEEDFNKLEKVEIADDEC